MNTIKSIKKLEAIHYYQIDKYDRALDCFFETLSEQPNDVEVLFFISNCYFQLDKCEESIDFCRQALAKNYHADLCNDLLGKIYMNTDCFIEAEKCFIEALRIHPNSAETLAAYSCLILKAGYPNKAKELLNKALELKPESKEVLHYSYLYYLSKNNKKALKSTLQVYFEVADKEVDKLVKAGISRYYAGDYKSAKEALGQAFVLDPTNESIHNLLNFFEWNGSIIMLPEKIINRIGGAKVIWLLILISLMLLNSLKEAKLFLVVTIIYVLIAVYIGLAIYMLGVTAITKFMEKWVKLNGQN